MAQTPVHSPGHGEADREKRLVALTSVLAAVFLTGLKLVVGVRTGSLGILSEAAHSALDLVAAVVTLLAVRVSGRPADRDHTYGHGKYENLSALFETVLLLGTCVWIGWEAIDRLFFENVHVESSIWAFAIMAISIAVDWSRSRALKRVADKYDSQALEADALHFSTDIWSSAVVIAGLALVFLAERLNLPWLAKADALAALGVAGIVVHVSVQLARKSLADLLDAAPPDIQERVSKAAHVAGVLDVRKVRIRRSGPETFADVTLAVSRGAAFERAHAVADAAEAAIRREVPGADVVVHVEPVEPADEGLLETIRHVAARLGMGAHGIRIYEQQGRGSVELHLEVSDALSLREAHALVTRFERALRGAMPALERVVTHIEPAGERSARRLACPDDELPVRQALTELLADCAHSWHAHDVQVQRVGEELAVSFHCAMAADTSIGEAHAITEQLEKDLRARVPDLGRVVIHVEPPEGDEHPAAAK